MIVEPAEGDTMGRQLRSQEFRCLFDVRRVLYDVKERERKDSVELGALLIRSPQGSLYYGVIRLLASLRKLHVSRDTISTSRRADGC